MSGMPSVGALQNRGSRTPELWTLTDGRLTPLFHLSKTLRSEIRNLQSTIRNGPRSVSYCATQRPHDGPSHHCEGAESRCRHPRAPVFGVGGCARQTQGDCGDRHERKQPLEGGGCLGRPAKGIQTSAPTRLTVANSSAHTQSGTQHSHSTGLHRRATSPRRLSGRVAPRFVCHMQNRLLSRLDRPSAGDNACRVAQVPAPPHRN